MESFVPVQRFVQDLLMSAYPPLLLPPRFEGVGTIEEDIRLMEVKYDQRGHVCSA